MKIQLFTILVAVAATGSYACSSAPAKGDIPPVADEVNKVGAVEKPTAPDEVEVEEPAERIVGFDCESSDLIALEVKADAKPPTVAAPDAEPRLIAWSDDLNSDETPDLLVKDVDCSKAGCNVSVYLQCPSGDFYLAYQNERALEISPSMESDGDFARLQVVEPGAEKGSPAVVTILAWGGTEYAAPTDDESAEDAAEPEDSADEADVSDDDSDDDAGGFGGF